MARRIRKQREFIVRVTRPQVPEHYKVMACDSGEAAIKAHNAFSRELRNAGEEKVEVNPWRL